MKLLGKVSGWARRGVLAVGALLMTLVALIATTATAHAGLDDELTLVDGKGRLLRIQQWDTFLNGVFPLDRNRLTREWFHSGRAVYEVTGAAGGVLLRPYARLISSAGDSVTTYGETWDMK
ncbi:MspA family porin [Mycobacteroides abscessus]|uniref:MspA family porin n=1 Tax=Mycobacteroides abscessus TaxID=36809 RepID=UPI0009296D3D|nr:MspA family porin [Mycobacteroides abscessus]SIK04766.1 Hypothetical porin precursor [Mycobacteroides abscessus subsp. abscessus]